MNFNLKNKTENKSNNQNDFLKNLQSQVKNKNKSLNHYNKLVKSNVAENIEK